MNTLNTHTSAINNNGKRAGVLSSPKTHYALCILRRSIHPEQKSETGELERMAGQFPLLIMCATHAGELGHISSPPMQMKNGASSKAALNQIGADSSFMMEISKGVTQSGHLLHPLSEGKTHIVRGKDTLPRAAEGSQPVSCPSRGGILKERRR